MKKLLLLALLFVVAIATQAQTTPDAGEDSRQDVGTWQPTKSWPFVYQQFTDAVIYTQANQRIKAKANVHVGRATLWYESKGKKLSAKDGTVARVVFTDGSEYININNHLCQVLRTDTVDGQQARFLMSPQIDRDAFEQLAKNSQMGTMVIDDFGAGFQDFASGVRDNEGMLDFDNEPLPMRPRFYADYRGDRFELTHGNITKRMPTRQERNAYGAYTRKAEVLYNSRRSMEDVWTTFFLK